MGLPDGSNHVLREDAHHVKATTALRQPLLRRVENRHLDAIEPIASAVPQGLDGLEHRIEQRSVLRVQHVGNVLQHEGTRSHISGRTRLRLRFVVSARLQYHGVVVHSLPTFGDAVFELSVHIPTP